ncbi:MAG: 30S ribosomal protein S1 [Candidatus Dependentiae bacterium]
MSKELIRPEQFAKVNVIAEDLSLEISPEMQKEIAQFYDGILENMSPGKLVVGKVISVTPDGVLVDINYKSEGLISRYEFGPHELKELKAGDEIEVILDELESIDGNVVLSYEKAKALKAWSEIIKLFEEEKPVQGLVTHKVKGGLSVDIGIPAFLPGSQIDLQRVTDFDQYVGQNITANIIKVNQKRGNVIISRRKHLSEQRSEARKKILDTLSEGQTIQGIVKNITNYGVFIDIGGVDGLLHITDMTWGRISHPSELVRIGDQITTKVLSFDKDNEKISLGLKQLSDNPWEEMGDSLKEGAKIKGKVSSITDYGLFVEIAKGIEGLVHISEISWTDRIADLRDKFRVGDEVEVLVVSLDKENRRMSLSIKQLAKNPWEAIAEQFKVGNTIKGTISNITDFGIFVQLIPGIDGLVHISDLSWTEHIEHPGDIYKRGSEVEAVILGVDKDSKKVSLGIKQLADDPWKLIEEQYPVGKIIDGEISKITNFGAFVKLPSGIEGLVHISEYADRGVDKLEEILKVGEKHQYRVVNVNKDEHKLGLSPKLEADTKAAPAARAPRQKVAKKTPKAAPAVSKTKSQFQIALEEHAARKDDKEDK